MVPLGAVKLTVAWVFPATALTPVGALGTVAGVIELEGELEELAPIALVAVTVNV
jgi:hypothetical protein